jgi:hypothetical protein
MLTHYICPHSQFLSTKIQNSLCVWPTPCRPYGRLEDAGWPLVGHRLGSSRQGLYIRGAMDPRHPMKYALESEHRLLRSSPLLTTPHCGRRWRGTWPVPLARPLWLRLRGRRHRRHARALGRALLRSLESRGGGGRWMTGSGRCDRNFGVF